MRAKDEEIPNGGGVLKNMPHVRNQKAEVVISRSVLAQSS
jgi:hypothetical protein